MAMGGKTIAEPEVLLLVAAARLSGRVKKSLRGDKKLEQFLPAMASYRDEILKLCPQVAANHGSTLEQCASVNVRKLGSRSERNTMYGDGDTR